MYQLRNVDIISDDSPTVGATGTMDQGTAALWAASIGAGTSPLALRANAKSTRRQLEGQRAQASADAEAASRRLAAQADRSAREAAQVREYYDGPLRDVFETIRADLRARRLDQEKVAAYRSAALWFFESFWGLMYRDSEWTDEVHTVALAGPPMDVLAALAVLAPPSWMDEFEDARQELLEHSAAEIRSDSKIRAKLLETRDELRELVAALAVDLQSPAEPPTNRQHLPPL